MPPFKTIAIFGGGFDPIHIAHEAILTTLAKSPEIEKTLLIPYHQSPFDKTTHSPVEHRVNMALLVAEQFCNVEVDVRETTQPGPSYTIDTLTALKNDYPDRAFLLVLSTESLAHFEQWKDWRAILHMANIAVFKRRSFDSVPSSLAPQICKRIDELWHKPFGQIVELPTAIPDVSSTIIRKAIKTNHPFTHWLNPKVCTYLQSHHLYRGPQ